MKRSFIFSISLVTLFTAIIAPDRVLGYDPYGIVKEAYELLENEVARDTKLLSAPMNISRLKMTRKMFLADIPKKEKILERMKKKYPEKMASQIIFFKNSVAIEKRIANNTRIGKTQRVRARRLIKTYLPKKRETIKKLRKAL